MLKYSLSTHLLRKPLNTNSSVAGHVACYALSSLLPAAATLVSSSLFTRLITTKSYGHYSLSLILVNFLTLGTSQWLQQSVNRFLPANVDSETIEVMRNAVSVSVFLNCIAVLAISLLMWIALRAFRAQDYLPFLLPSTLMAIAGTIVMTGLVVLQAEMRSTEYGIFRNISVVGSLILAFGGLLNARVASRMMWGSAVGYLLVIPALLHRTHLFRKPSVPSPAVIKCMRKMALYGLPLAGWTACSALLFFSDRFLINYYQGPSQVGVYSATYMLMTGSVTFIASPIILAAHPFLMRTWDSGNREHAAAWLRKVVTLFVVVGSVLVLSMTLLSNQLAVVLLGHSFREAGPIMPLMAASTVVWQIGSYIQKPLEFAGRTRTMLAILVVLLVFNVSFNVPLVSRFGYKGAAWNSLLTNCIYVGLVHVSGRDILRWRLRAWPLLEAFALICIIFSAVMIAERFVQPFLGSDATSLVAETSALFVIILVCLFRWKYYRLELLS